MIRVILAILLAAPVWADAAATENGKSLADFETIAMSSPLITQIYTNPELSDLKDVKLTPDSEIKLYEDLSDEICQTLTGLFKGRADILCYNEIRTLLVDAKTWNDFNHNFAGKDYVSPKISTDFAAKLKADGVVNSFLMFSYYENPKKARHLEVHFEWYLIDLATGESVLGDKYDCQDDLIESPESLRNEYDCFEGIIGSFSGLSQNR